MVGKRNKVIEQLTRPNALFLAAAAQNKHEQLGVVHSWFGQTHVGHGAHWPLRGKGPSLLRWLDTALGGDLVHQMSLFDEPSEEAGASEAPPHDASGGELLKQLLQAADTGILDVRTRKEAGRFPRKRFEFLHRGAGSTWLDLSQESQGTVAIFRLAPRLIEALGRGSVVVVDELDASLHPRLARELVGLFNDPKTNPRNAQLIFATHNTSLVGRVLGEPPLRRDQIWLTEKTPEGQTRIYPLTEFKPRKEENVERGYLQGRYGAVPYLGELLPPEPDEVE